LKAFIITAALALIAACGSLEIRAAGGDFTITLHKNGTFTAVGPPGSCIQAVDKYGNLKGDPIQLDGEGVTTGPIPAGSRGVVKVPCPTSATAGNLPFSPKGQYPNGSWHEIGGALSTDGAGAIYALRVRAHSFEDATRKAVPFIIALTEDPTVAGTIGKDIRVDSLVGYTSQLTALGLPTGDTSTFSLGSQPHSVFDVLHNGTRVNPNPEAAFGKFWYASATISASEFETEPGSAEAVEINYQSSQPIDEVGFKITF